MKILFLIVTSATLIVAGLVQPAYAAEPTKSARECNDEYASRQSGLTAFGVSAPAFYHECWWHSSKGKQTDLSAVTPSLKPERGSGFNGWPKIDGYETRVPVVHMGAHRRLDLASRRHRQRLKLSGRRFNKPSGREEASIIHSVQEGLKWVRSVGDGKDIDALSGRRAWIQGSEAYSTALIPAVIVGPLEYQARPGTLLHCWTQTVLFIKRKPYSQPALVCDEKIDLFQQDRWFSAYNKPEKRLGERQR